MAYQIYSSTALSASTTVANWEHIRQGHLMPHAGASLANTTSALDLGSSTYAWAGIYVNEWAGSVTVSAPIKFNAIPSFNTLTTFTVLNSMPTHMICQCISTAGSFPATSAAELAMPITTVTVNQIAGSSVTASGQITLPTGSYVIFASALMGIGQASMSARFYNITDGSTVYGESQVADATTARYYAVINGPKFATITETTWEFRVAVSTSTTGIGTALNDGFPNKAGEVIIFKVS